MIAVLLLLLLHDWSVKEQRKDTHLIIVCSVLNIPPLSWECNVLSAWHSMVLEQIIRGNLLSVLTLSLISPDLGGSEKLNWPG